MGCGQAAAEESYQQDRQEDSRFYHTFCKSHPDIEGTSMDRVLKELIRKGDFIRIGNIVSEYKLTSEAYRVLTDEIKGTPYWSNSTELSFGARLVLACPELEKLRSLSWSLRDDCDLLIDLYIATSGDIDRVLKAGMFFHCKNKRIAQVMSLHNTLLKK